MGEEKDLERQCQMLEEEVMSVIHRAYEEYDLPQDAIWGVLLKSLMREMIYHVGSEYFKELDDEYDGEE
tara:strand:+ start:3725 stop:3931 length:207 start_codon:yes stop_codon:yes gene_type:complete